jgi:hypothetical protein
VSAAWFRTRIACGTVFPFLAEKVDEMLTAGAEIFFGEGSGLVADFTCDIDDMTGFHNG